LNTEIVAKLDEALSGELKLSIRRVTSPDTRRPAAPSLQTALIPTANTIVDAAVALTGISILSKKGLYLTPEEIEEITLKGRYSAQRRVLRTLVDFKRRADGSILLDRSIYEAWLGGGKRGLPNAGKLSGVRVTGTDRIEFTFMYRGKR